MAPLKDPERLAAYKDALGNWSFSGYVRFELSETAFRWVKREIEDVSLKDIARLIFEYVDRGGKIDEVRETRPEWSDYEFHYDIRLPVNEKLIYIETRLNFSPPFVPDQSSIVVVNIHDV